jgi:GNAT superfamily N-acetyltransferase
MCWHRWCWEEQGRELDHAAFLAQQQAKLAGGAFMQVIGWEGPEPMAMVEIYISYDPMRRVYTAVGDKAWVHPDHRQHGVFTSLLGFLRSFMEYVGVSHWTVPVGAGDDATAAFLRGLYEREGFKLAGLTMIQEAA